MYNRDEGGVRMNRTAEKVLSIISVVLTVLALIPSFMFGLFGKVISEGSLRDEIEMDLLTDPDFTGEDVDIILSVLEWLGGFGWFAVVVLLISLIVTIVGIVAIWNNKNPKLAGIMFIIGGLFAFVLSLGSILLYITAVLCFTKKAATPPVMEDTYDDMRPL